MKRTNSIRNRLLAAILAAMTTVGFVGCSSGQSQAAAITKLKEMGGTVIGETTPTGISYRLNLTESPIKDDDLKDVSEISNVELLWLYNTQISDAGLIHIAKLESLKNLDLRRTQITDAGLEHLKGLKKLEQLDVSLTAVTNGAAFSFQLAHPECNVTYGGPQKLDQWPE